MLMAFHLNVLDFSYDTFDRNGVIGWFVTRYGTCVYRSDARDS